MPESTKAAQSPQDVVTLVIWLQSQFNQVIRNQGTILKHIEDVRKICAATLAGQDQLRNDHQAILTAIQMSENNLHNDNLLILDAIHEITNPPPEKATSLGLRADAPVPK